MPDIPATCGHWVLQRLYIATHTPAFSCLDCAPHLHAAPAHARGTPLLLLPACHTRFLGTKPAFLQAHLNRSTCLLPPPSASSFRLLPFPSLPTPALAARSPAARVPLLPACSRPPGSIRCLPAWTGLLVRARAGCMRLRCHARCRCAHTRRLCRLPAATRTRCPLHLHRYCHLLWFCGCRCWEFPTPDGFWLGCRDVAFVGFTTPHPHPHTHTHTHPQPVPMVCDILFRDRLLVYLLVKMERYDDVEHSAHYTGDTTTGGRVDYRT